MARLFMSERFSAEKRLMTQPEFEIVCIVIVVVVAAVVFPLVVYLSSLANTFVIYLTDYTTNWHSR